MVLPKRDIETAIAVLQKIVKNEYEKVVHLALDAGISPSSMYGYIHYGIRPKPGGRKERAILELVDRLKQKYPEDCPTKVTQK